jgi:hypothetical protein
MYISFKTICNLKGVIVSFDAVQRYGSKSTPRTANPYKSADPILHREPPLLQNRSNATGDFKHLKVLAYLSLDLIYHLK